MLPYKIGVSGHLHSTMENNYYQYTVPVIVAGPGAKALPVNFLPEIETDPSCSLEDDGAVKILTMGDGGVIV